MLYRLKIVSVIILFIVASSSLFAQDRFTTIENKIKELAKETPGLNEKVQLSVNGIPIHDFILGIATSNNLNISVDAGLTTKITNNFPNVPVSDVLIFLCKKYDLDIAFIGNIMSISQYITPVAPPIKPAPHQIKVSYDKAGDLLSMDLSNDSLSSVAKELTKVTQKNVVFAPDLNNKMVNGYIQNTPFNSALEKFAFANDLKITPTKDNFYLVERSDAVSASNVKSGGKGGQSLGAANNAPTAGLTVKSDDKKLISVDAVNVPINDVLAAVSAELKNSYYLFTEPKGNTTLSVKDATYDEFLNKLFNGTEYTFKTEAGIYLFGDRSSEGLRSTKVYVLKYRTVEKVIDIIPADLKKGVDIKTFTDLNSLILCGSAPRINELELFLRDIDRVVPVISIEVMIVDINNSHAVSAGITAGLGKSATPTGGEVFPSLDLNLGAGSINSIIDGINGLGVVNLGKVTPNFYLNMQLLENNGDVKINSTPLLSTLNGNEAKMSIGETRYYEERSTNTITTQSTTTVASRIFKPLEAKFSMTVNPIVSGDEQITLSITVTQTTFTGRSGEEGSPYNLASRDFQSLIRVKNQEMIMLGGLDNENKNETGSGVPILSRIPVIKWFFGKHTKSKSKSKLTIFIKPTVIY